jgi:hypothetical protein
MGPANTRFSARAAAASAKLFRQRRVTS